MAKKPKREEHAVVHSPGLKPENWMHFIQLDLFERQWGSLGLTDEHLRRLEIAIMAKPKAAPVIPGTGSLRKLRMEKNEGGKSGGYRVCYFLVEQASVAVLVAIYDKAKQANIAPGLLKAFKTVIAKVTKQIEEGKG